MVIEGELGREELTLQRNILRTLRRILERSDWHSFLKNIVSKSSDRSVLVNECQLSSSWIKQDLMNHSICDRAVLGRSVEKDAKEEDHDGKSSREGLVEWILLEEVSESNKRNYES